MPRILSKSNRTLLNCVETNLRELINSTIVYLGQGQIGFSIFQIQQEEDSCVKSRKGHSSYEKILIILDRKFYFILKIISSVSNCEFIYILWNKSFFHNGNFRYRGVKHDMYCDPKTIVPPKDLKELIGELHKVFESDHVNVEYVTQLMASYKSNPKDWKKFAIFDVHRYS